MNAIVLTKPTRKRLKKVAMKLDETESRLNELMEMIKPTVPCQS